MINSRPRPLHQTSITSLKVHARPRLRPLPRPSNRFLRVIARLKPAAPNACFRALSQSASEIGRISRKIKICRRSASAEGNHAGTVSAFWLSLLDNGKSFRDRRQGRDRHKPQSGLSRFSFEVHQNYTFAKRSRFSLPLSSGTGFNFPSMGPHAVQTGPPIIVLSN